MGPLHLFHRQSSGQPARELTPIQLEYVFEFLLRNPIQNPIQVILELFDSIFCTFCCDISGICNLHITVQTQDILPRREVRSSIDIFEHSGDNALSIEASSDGCTLIALLAVGRLDMGEAVLSAEHGVVGDEDHASLPDDFVKLLFRVVPWESDI